MMKLRSQFLVALSVAVACDGIGGPCEHPLEEWCDGPCSTLDARVDELEAYAAATYFWVGARLYQCGSDGFRLAVGDGLTGWSERFDAAGEMVGAETFTDVVYECDGKDVLRAVYGEARECDDACLLAPVADAEATTTFGWTPERCGPARRRTSR